MNNRNGNAQPCPKLEQAVFGKVLQYFHKILDHPSGGGWWCIIELGKIYNLLLNCLLKWHLKRFSVYFFFKSLSFYLVHFIWKEQNDKS